METQMEETIKVKGSAVERMIAWAVEAKRFGEVGALSAYFDCIDLLIGAEERARRFENALAGKK